MPFGEMTITLDDVFCITGLPITGVLVYSRHSVTPYATDDISEMLGVSPAEAVKRMRGARGSL